MYGNGFLAIWSDLAPEDEIDWAHWMTREHAPERVGIESFLACRIFRAAGTPMNRYFILYDLEQPAAVAGPAYLARLNAPTPWSQRIMPRLRNFVRGGGRIAATCGIGHGGVAAILPLPSAPEWEPATVCRDIAALDRIVAAWVLLTDAEQTAIRTQEKDMRGGDRSFAGLLLIEGLTASALRAALWRLQSIVPAIDSSHIASQPLYTAMFSLAKPARGPALASIDETFMRNTS